MDTQDGVRIARNVRLLAHHTLGTRANIGEGMAVKDTADGRRLLYIAHVQPPIALSVLDVTAPHDPELLWELPCAHEQVRGNSLAIRDDTMVLANQVDEPGLTPAGFFVFDLSTPERPAEVSFFDTSGPHSRGTHFVSFMDGRYAHISTGASDFVPNNPKDHQFYMIVDLLDRKEPREVGRWWLPGQREGDVDEIVRHTEFDHGFRVHHTLCYPEAPDRAYLGYIDGGIVILDISDMSRPRQISRLDYHPPFPGFTHTVVPLFDRQLLLVSDEASGPYNGKDWPKRYWIVDVRDERNPLIISSFPVPDGFDDLFQEGGRIGAHNIHENEPEPGTAKLQRTAVGTWFSAGLRIYDIQDPFRPEEIGAFLPETPDGQQGCRINDVFVDDRGLIYAGDREKGGLYILEYTGDVPLV